MEKFDSLLDEIKFADFPIVARLYTTSEVAGIDLVDGKEVLIRRHFKVKYAQVKVLDFNNKDEIQEKKGIEFIMEHDNCVDKTFLIPSKYTASLKFIHRPGTWKRFASISQVLKELPRFVLVCEETIATPSNGIGKNIIIPDKTLLEVVRKVSLDGATYLECSDGKDSFSFRETYRVNFTEVEDEKLYHIYELVRLKLLPRVFQFQNVDPEDVVHIDEELNSSLLTVAEGPLELIKFTDVDVVVGWVRDNSKRTYKTIVIPSRLWPFIKIEKTSFSDKNTKDKYIERKYNRCINTDFVERKLYEMQMDEAKIIWLASPDLYVRNYSGNCMFDVLSIDYKDSEEDDDGMNDSNTFQCPPPIPARPLRLLDKDKLKEKQTLFSKVHQELLKWFKPKRITKSNDANQSKEIGKKTRLQKGQSTAHESIETHTNNSANDIKVAKNGKNYKEQQRDESMITKNSKQGNMLNKGQHRSSQYLHPYEDSPHRVQSNKNRNVDLSSSNLYCSDAYSESDSDTSDSDSSREYHYIEPELSDRSIISASEHKSNLQSVVEKNSSQYLHPNEDHPHLVQSNKNMKTALSSPDLSLSEAYSVSNSDTSDSELSRVYDCIEPEPDVFSEIFVSEHKLNINSMEEQNDELYMDPRSKDILDCFTPAIELSISSEVDETTCIKKFSISTELNSQDVEILNQTAEEFYQYSVSETSDCFKLCGLTEFAEKCQENKLDGSFFRNFDLQVLKDEPFNFKSFHIVMIKKIIFEGWRPKV